MFRFFTRMSLGTQFGLLLALLLAFVSIAGSIVGRSIVESQVLNESRSIADMTEHIGKWAAQYNGVHVKTSSTSSTTHLGGWLQRSIYARKENEQKTINGVRIEDRGQPINGTDPVDAYHWKNPALVQREVSDVAVASGGKVQFRITSSTVLNLRNSPDEFEQLAIKKINANYVERINRGEKPAAYYGTATRTSGPPAEYWAVEGGHLRYSRAIITAKSCLGCHGSSESAPDFLKSNMTFNGGGGFGYKEGQPDGIISVKIPIPAATEALASSLTPLGWGALAAIVVLSLLILLFVVQKIIRPINHLRLYADKLSSSSVGDHFDVPEFISQERKSANEIHRLAGSIGEMGQSVKILFQKLQNARK